MGAGVSLHGTNPEPLMSALGQKQTLRGVRPMSALPPKADITERDWHVRFLPKADSCTATKNPSLNHIVCSGQHYFRYGNTKGFGGLEINV
jgi:hypothetical protein